MPTASNRHSSFPRAILFIFGLVALLTAAPLHADTPAGKTQKLFWKVTSPTTTVYFLGSVHLASDDSYPLPPEIESAFIDSASLLVEADVTKVDQATLALKVMQNGMYPQGDSLDKHISPDTMKALTAWCADNNKLPAALVTPMKPVMAAMTVEAMAVEKLGMDPDKGVDVHFLKEAAASNKKVVELESADAQLDLLMNLDDKLAEKWLTDTLKENSSDEVKKVLESWKAGDAKTIEKLMLEDEKNDPAAQKLDDLLIYKRNDEMVKKIQDLLKGNNPAFVVVGAAHLLGDRGIIEQLKKSGFKVEMPTLTAPPATAPASNK